MSQSPKTDALGSEDGRPVVTRFAPSPTGYLHIGGARTALFNWLYARGRGGTFLLRIEDTDRARHNDAAVEAILDGLAWLGLDWDGDPVSQYARRARHVEAAEALLAAGAAYRCYMTPEEIDAARAAAREAGVRFESPWRDAAPTGDADRPHTVRFRAPREGETVVRDAVQGAVAFPNSALDDLIILRSGDAETRAATYNLAVVVDDADMGVTHVIRGDDHLANAARQQQIYEALDFAVPTFAHVPLIHGADGAKLSKRHGALGVEAYRDDGYLPDALANYLLRLGWAHGDEELIDRARALEVFDLEGVNKAPARLDLDKLAHVNGHYMKALEAAAFLARAAPFLEAAGVDPADAEIADALRRAAPFLQERAQTLKDVPDAALFVTRRRPIEASGKAGKALRKDGAAETLTALCTVLDACADWSSPNPIDAALQQYAEANGLSFGQIGPPARAALTGGSPSPSLAETLFSLGKSESLSRLRDKAA
ncbi:MAG: glutamate--tRNA ligase [Pseudomonadota bacterium]